VRADGRLFEKLELLKRTADDAYRIGRVDVALQGYRKALDVARELADEIEIEDAVSWVGTCLFNLGRAEECLSAFGEILEKLDGRHGSNGTLHRARCSALKYWLWLSINWKGKLPYLTDMIARGRQFLGDLGLPGIEDSLLLFESWIARFRGKSAEAIALADRAVGKHREDRSGSSFVGTEYLRAAARFRLDAGIADQAVEGLAREMFVLDRDSVPFIGEVRGHQALSRLFALRGNPDLALDHALQADAAARRTTHKASQSESLLILARAWLGKRDQDRALACVREALLRANEYHSELIRHDARLCELEVRAARLAAGADRPAEIVDPARASASAARTVDVRLESAFCSQQVRRVWEERVAPELRRQGESAGLAGFPEVAGSSPPTL